MKLLECDFILASDCVFFSVLKYGRIIGIQNKAIAQNTMVGWVEAEKIESKGIYYTTIKSPPNLISFYKMFAKLKKYTKATFVKGRRIL